MDLPKLLAYLTFLNPRARIMQLIPRPEEDGLHNIAAVLFKQPQRTIKLPAPPSRHPFQVRASTIARASVMLSSSETAHEHAFAR